MFAAGSKATLEEAKMLIPFTVTRRKTTAVLAVEDSATILHIMSVPAALAGNLLEHVLYN